MKTTSKQALILFTLICVSRVYSQVSAWEPKSNLPSDKNFPGFTFTVDEYAYYGGAGDYVNTLYKYNPNTNVWTSLPAIPFEKINPFYFTINNKVYVGGGLGVPGTSCS